MVDLSIKGVTTKKGALKGLNSIARGVTPGGKSQ